MKIQRLVVGPLQTNTYILSEESRNQALVVDPGDEADKIRSVIERQRLQVKAVLLTHGHFDHIGAMHAFGAPVYIHPADVRMLEEMQSLRPAGEPQRIGIRPVRLMDEGTKFAVGTDTVRVLHTPGHSPGSVCLLSDEVLLSGDTLFSHGVGRTDLPGGEYRELACSLRDKVFRLDGTVRVLPGHGPETTIAAERDRRCY